MQWTLEVYERRNCRAAVQVAAMVADATAPKEISQEEDSRWKGSEDACERFLEGGTSPDLPSESADRGQIDDVILGDDFDSENARPTAAELGTRFGFRGREIRSAQILLTPSPRLPTAYYNNFRNIRKLHSRHASSTRRFTPDCSDFLCA